MGEWGNSCTHVMYSSCVFMSWTHVLLSWPTLMLCTPVVCSWFALMLCTHVVHSCCVFMACPHVVHSCCVSMFCPRMVHSCCVLMACPHVVHSCCVLNDLPSCHCIHGLPSFEGVCFNSRHPGHCAREGRLRAAGSDTTSPGSPGVPGRIPNGANSLCFYSKSYSTDTPVHFCFNFFIPSHLKHTVFIVFVGRWPARNALNTRCFS